MFVGPQHDDAIKSYSELSFGSRHPLYTIKVGDGPANGTIKYYVSFLEIGISFHSIPTLNYPRPPPLPSMQILFGQA